MMIIFSNKMGVDGSAYTIIYGPKESLDEIEIDVKNGIFASPMTVSRYEREHDRKLSVYYDFRNISIFDLLLKYLEKYPKCFMKNGYRTENGNEALMIARYDSKGELRKEEIYWDGPTYEDYYYRDYYDYYQDIGYIDEKILNEVSKPSICDFSLIKYKLHAFGHSDDLTRLEQTYELKNIKKYTNANNNTNILNADFETRDVSPVEFCKTSFAKFTSCRIEIDYKDSKGVNGTISVWGKCNSFFEYKMFTEEEERTLDDFSLKD